MLALEGTFRPDRHRARDRAPGGGEALDAAAPPPLHLAPQVAAIWRELAGRLPAGLIREADAVLLENLAQAVSLHRECSRILAAEGPFSTGSEGQPVQHPASKTLISISATIAALCGQLGLSPQGRLKLADVAPPPAPPLKDDPWATFAPAVQRATALHREAIKRAKRRRSGA